MSPPAGRPSCWRPTPADPAELFGDDELDRARRYQRPLRRLRALRAGAGLAVTAAFVVTGAGPAVAGLVGGSGWVVELVAVLVALELAHLVVDVPLDVWVDLVHDRRWGLSTTTAGRLAADEAKSFVLGTMVASVVLVAVYALVRSTPWWWAWAWVVVVAVGAVAGLLVPVVVAPWFNRFAPLPPGELADRVTAVAERAGVPLARVEVADESRRSHRDNAYVTGLGPTRRIVLFDNLLASPPELVEQVVAHELGHVRRRHLARQAPAAAGAALVVLAVLGVIARQPWPFGAFGLSGPGDPAGLALALLCAQLVTAPTALPLAWLSRAFEREADAEALGLLDRPDLVEAMLRRLQHADLVDPAPTGLDRVRAGHPPVAERIAFARAWPRPVTTTTG